MLTSEVAVVKSHHGISVKCSRHRDTGVARDNDSPRLLTGGSVSCKGGVKYSDPPCKIMTPPLPPPPPPPPPPHFPLNWVSLNNILVGLCEISWNEWLTVDTICQKPTSLPKDINRCGKCTVYPPGDQAPLDCQCCDGQWTVYFW